MNRLQQMNNTLMSYKVEWTKKKIDIIRQFSSGDLDPVIITVMHKAKMKQMIEEWYPAYFSVFFLNTSTYTETFEYQICLSNNQLYLDDNKILAYWRPSCLMVNCLEEKKIIENLLRKSFVRVQDYEVNYCARLILSGYKEIFEVYVKDMINNIFSLPCYKEIKKRDPFTFIYGHYMGEIKELMTDPLIKQC